jgi:hypothetical protein
MSDHLCGWCGPGPIGARPKHREGIAVVGCSCGCHRHVQQGESGAKCETMEAQVKTAPTGALTPNAGASPTIGASTNA